MLRMALDRDPAAVHQHNRMCNGKLHACSFAQPRAFLATIAKVRALTEAQVNQLIQPHTAACTLSLLGEPRVNVLEPISLSTISPNTFPWKWGEEQFLPRLFPAL